MFDQGHFRKNTKSTLYTEFSPIEAQTGSCFYVIDGGFLLNKVVWAKNTSFSSIFAGYVSYQFGSEIKVIFDSYESYGLKDEERRLRTGKETAVEVEIEDNKVFNLSLINI